ncbi:MAG TPA: hypothetical protein PLL50_01465 [Propionicimonas sp.]|nr:hypothetical protein [Propionicimonas sp.]HQA77006.1 hypothetical protein [Propionicimonas sp.]HQD96157.1 hypothetical protein [Propionicimonas sp.]
MSSQPIIIDAEQTRQRSEACLASGDFKAADAGYAELRRLGALSASDAGKWLRAVRALTQLGELDENDQRPSLEELVAAFPDDQDLLEFVAAEVWQRAESHAVPGEEDAEIARRAWQAALHMAGPVPESDAAGVRLIRLVDRFFQAGRRQQTPIGSYPEYEQALVRFAAAGPESTLRAADLLAAESPVLALELVATSEISAASVLVRAVASAEMEDHVGATSLFDELTARWGQGFETLDVEDRSRWVQSMTDVGRFAEAEAACLRTIEQIEHSPETLAGMDGAQDHWRHVYHLLAYRLAAQQGRYREAWDHLRRASTVLDADLSPELRRSVLRVRILLADRDEAEGILAELAELASCDPYDTAYAEACLWAGTQWGTPDADASHHASGGTFSGARYAGQAAARALLAQAGPEVSSRQLIRLALLAGDDDRAQALLTAEPLVASDPWPAKVLAALVALRQGDDLTANRLIAEVMPQRRHDLDLRVLDAQASLISGDYKVSLREAMAITDSVGVHILARVIRAESEFEAALAMVADEDASHGSVENAQQLMAAVSDYRTVADLQRDTIGYLRTAAAPDAVAIGSEPLPPRLFTEVCRRGLHAAILAQEALDRLGLRGDRQLVTDAQDLVQHLRSVTRPCCRTWGSRPSRLLHQVRHLVDRDEATRLALLMISHRWSAWRRRLQNFGFIGLGALVTWAGLTNVLPGPESDTIRALVLGLGVLLLLMPFARSLKVGVVELSRDADAAPLSGRSKSLRTSRLLLRANHLGTFPLPSPPEKGRRAHAQSRD